MSVDSDSFERAGLELMRSSAKAQIIAIEQAAEASFERDYRLEDEADLSSLDLARQEGAALGGFMLYAAIGTKLPIRQRIARRLLHPRLVSNTPDVQFVRSMTAQTKLILTSPVEYIPHGSSELQDVQAINGWQFTAVGGYSRRRQGLIESLALSGMLIATNIERNEASNEEREVAKIEYDFTDFLPGYTPDPRPRVGFDMIDDENSFQEHRAIFRAARLALGDKLVQ